MDKHSIEVLELQKIIDEVADQAATDIGRKIVENLSPVYDVDYIKESLARVSVARELLDNYGEPHFGGISDIRELIKKASKDMVLLAGDIVDIRNTLQGFEGLKKYFQEIVDNTDPSIIERNYARVTDQGMQVKPLYQLKREIDNCIDEYGEIRDTASSKLKSLRGQMTTLENRIRDRLESIIKGTKYQSMLQESLVTRRENRYVVPVKKEYRNTFSGIVHDQSASGMTIYMEPMAIVKLNNRLREVKGQEEVEIQRILQELTYRIKGQSQQIKENLKLASLLDVIFARAYYSQKIDGIAPDINDHGRVDIKGGRHPLLQEDPVPIDINVGQDFNTLVITGPNTGGKTVALKTVGLFVLMVQSGLHIPAARGSEISLFARVFADIGDEQSIEQNLSTFSSHMNKIRYYLKEADEKSLVLLDELGAGTDPKEGAALGISILENLKFRGVTSVATTHYSQLKSYAYSTERVENASVEFDLETLKPTYRLIMGVPGGSNAFEIALRLGLPEAIVEQAKGYINREDMEVESIIADLNSERKKYRNLRMEVEAEKNKYSNLRQEYEQKLSRLEEKEEEIVSQARNQAESIVDRARKETKRILRDLKQQDYTVRSEVDREENRINDQIKELEDRFFEEKEAREALTDGEQIEVGDQVRVKSVGKKGEVLDVDREQGQARIQAGVMKVTAGLEELEKVEIPEDHSQEMARSYRVDKSSNVSQRLDLRGERYHRAQQQLDKYLDDALLAGFKQVEIIHGKGTGALRQAVQETLEDHPHISSFRLGTQKEGGGGVTIAELSP